MQFSCQSQWLLMILSIILAILPWASSRSVWPSIRTRDTSSYFEDSRGQLEGHFEDKRGLSVERRSGSDPWGICSSSITRIDCFYKYLSLYAEVLADMDDQDARTSRPMGKRSDPAFDYFEK